MAFLPTSELIAVAWLAEAVPDLPDGKVATSLPSDVAAFSDGFVTVSIVGGAPHPYVPMRRPVVQIDCWVATIGSTKPRWGRANDLAEIIRAATYPPESANSIKVTPRSGYDDARVWSAFLLTEPRRVEGDPNRHARFTFDMQFHWTTV
jgi:hypothetical protein